MPDKKQRLAQEGIRRRNLIAERDEHYKVVRSNTASADQKKVAQKRIDEITNALKVPVGLGQTKPQENRRPMVPGKDYDPAKITPNQAFKLMYDQYSGLPDYKRIKGELERRINEKFIHGEITSSADLWRESDDIYHTMTGVSPRLERKIAFDQKQNLPGSIKQATKGKDGTIWIRVNLPISRDTISLEFKRQPSLLELADAINKADKKRSIAKGIQHPDVTRGLDKMGADPIQAKISFMYGRDYVVGKGGEVSIPSDEIAKKIANVLGFANWENLRHKNSIEYKIFQAQVSGTSVTPDNQDKVFKDAGLTDREIGLIKRNPGLEKEHGALTYLRSMATIFSPSELWSIATGDARSNEEIAANKWKVGGIEMSEATGRNIIDFTTLLLGTILTGGAAGIGRAGVNGLARLGLRVGARAAAEAAVEGTARELTKESFKGLVFNFLKNSAKNGGLNALQAAPGVFKAASDRSALTGEDYWRAFGFSSKDAFLGAMKQFDPRLLENGTLDEQIQALVTYGMMGANLSSKVRTKVELATLNNSKARSRWHAEVDDAVRKGALGAKDAELVKKVIDTAALAWAKKKKGGSVSEFYEKEAPRIVVDGNAPEGSYLQIQKLLDVDNGKHLLPELTEEDRSKIPGKITPLKEFAARLQKFAEDNPVFEKGVQLNKLTDKEIVNTLFGHIHAEVDAWLKLAANYTGFFTKDINDVANPMLRDFFKKQHNIDLTDSQVKLFHLLSGLASAQRTPIHDSSVGFDMLENYLLTGDLSAKGLGEMFDYGSFNKVKKLINEKGLDGAMDWLSTNHSPEELSRTLGIPIDELRTTEYINPQEGGMGLLALGGPKMAVYILNRWGNRNLITKDMWYARSMARLTGQDLMMPSGKIRSATWATKGHGLRMRRLTDQTMRMVADKFGWDPIRVQEAMWDLEHMLYNNYGAGQQGTFISGGVRKAIEKRLHSSDGGAKGDSSTNVLERGSSHDVGGTHEDFGKRVGGSETGSGGGDGGGPNSNREGKGGKGAVEKGEGKGSAQESVGSTAKSGTEGLGDLSTTKSLKTGVPDGEVQAIRDSFGNTELQANKRERKGPDDHLLHLDQIGPNEFRKGAVSFTPGETPMVYLFTDHSDISTFLHEMAHVLRRTLDERQMETLIKAIGDPTTREGEEKFARGFERYMFEGKAPTPEQQQTFDAIRGKMMSVYGKLKGTEIEDSVSPRLRRTFDRMLGRNQFALPGLPNGIHAFPLDGMNDDKEEQIRKLAGGGV